MIIALDLSWAEAHGLVHSLEQYIEHVSREYLSPPSEIDPGRRVDLVDVLYKFIKACEPLQPPPAPAGEDDA